MQQSDVRPADKAYVMSGTGCRIYLILPHNAGGNLAGPLEVALSESSVACLLLETEKGRLSDRGTAARFKEIADLHDVAFLIEDNAEAAGELGADGIHFSRDHTEDEAAYQHARDLLGGDAIIGVDCGVSRHRAMVVGEQCADYVAFSEPPDEAGGSGKGSTEMISWWAELFVVPSVAWGITGTAAAETAARLGADFVALNADIWRDKDAAPQIIKDIHDHLNTVNHRA